MYPLSLCNNPSSHGLFSSVKINFSLCESSLQGHFAGFEVNKTKKVNKRVAWTHTERRKTSCQLLLSNLTGNSTLDSMLQFHNRGPDICHQGQCFKENICLTGTKLVFSRHKEVSNTLLYAEIMIKGAVHPK